MEKKNVPRKGTVTDPITGKKKIPFAIIKEAWIKAANYEKILVFQELEFAHQEETEYRLGDYVPVMKEGSKKKGQWTWGQYNPHILKNDFRKLIQKAREVGFNI